LRVRLWGTRGSLPTPGTQTSRYGGNTACVEVQARSDAVAVLDAGTGIRLLGQHLGDGVRRVDVLLTHLHMDHIVGLGFFDALHRPGLEVHLWGPATASLDLRGRLSRYLSPPLFPVRLRDLDCTLLLHDVPFGIFDIPGLSVAADLVCHPGPTVGYRLSGGGASLAYLPDHEPALGVRKFPDEPRWTSGYSLAEDVDVLLHDAQYTADEYEQRVGWGHSTLDHAVTFARHVRAGRLVAFHHDPTHGDELLDRLYAEPAKPGVVPAREGQEFFLGTDAA
jgi:phosphoribosyl 1,2-cyclic phosphodiesterase